MPTMPRMRLFVEAGLDAAALDAVWQASQRLKTSLGEDSDVVRWVKRDALHLTLRFLGEVEPERVDDLATALSELDGFAPIPLRLNGLGTFGGSRTSVIWAALARDDGYERLVKLRIALDAALAPAGFEPESGAYRPHLTLGRARRRATRHQRAAIRDAAADAALERFASVERVALVESTLTPQGPRYRRLAVVERGVEAGGEL